MSTVTGSSNQDAIALEIQVAAPPDRVFKALTDPSQLPLWWGQKGVYHTTHMHADLRPGGKWSSSGKGDDGKPFEVRGEYLEIDPPRLLVFTWISSWTDGQSSTVRWDLIPNTQGTLVKLHHSGLGTQPEAARGYSQGWPRVLEWMQAYLDKGETVDTRSA